MTATYDETGYNNYTDVFNEAVNNFAEATVVASMSKFFLRIEYCLIVAY